MDSRVTDVEFDPFCDPNSPKGVAFEDILAAARRIDGTIIRTPCCKAKLGEQLGIDLYYKEEYRQISGSCKDRGIRNMLECLSDEQKKVGIIMSSVGNAGVALSIHSNKMSVPAYVVLTQNVCLHKIAKCQELIGPRCMINGLCLSEAKKYAMTLAKEKKLYYINGYDHPNIIEGEGTIGIEIVEQVPGLDAVLLPVGGGSLIAGAATAIKHLKPDVEIYGVQTEKTTGMADSLKRGDRTRVEVGSTVADCLAINMVGVNTFHSVKSGIVDKMIIVKEDWVVRTMLHLIEDEKVVAEGGAAVTLAAIMAGLLPHLKGKKVVCLLSGGNVDLPTIYRIVERALFLEGRMVSFKVTIPDRPGSMGDICRHLGNIGATIRCFNILNSWTKGDIYYIEVKFTVETKSWDHVKVLTEMIKKNYNQYYFQEMSEQPCRPDTSRRGPCLAPNPVCMYK